MHFTFFQTYYYLLPLVYCILVFWVLISVVIISWTSEKPSQKKSDITVIWVSDWLKWVNLFKISSLESQFSTNRRTLSVFCCFLFAIFNNYIIVDPLRQVCESITTQSNNINSKQLSQSQVDP